LEPLNNSEERVKKDIVQTEVRGTSIMYTTQLEAATGLDGSWLSLECLHKLDNYLSRN
jgi:hypothetical protein